jgi:hypothetical protein
VLIERKKEFENLRRYLNQYDSLGELERHRRQELTATQARLFDEYYERRREQRELRGISVQLIVRRHYRVRVWRDRRGRFARHR